MNKNLKEYNDLSYKTSSDNENEVVVDDDIKRNRCVRFKSDKVESDIPKIPIVTDNSEKPKQEGTQQDNKENRKGGKKTTKPFPFVNKGYKELSSERGSVRVCSLKTNDNGEITQRSWENRLKEDRVADGWETPSRITVGKPLLLSMKIINPKGGTNVLTLYDEGSDANIISPRIFEQLKVGALLMDKPLDLHYADDTHAEATKRTIGIRFMCQGREFVEQFIVSPTELPGVDIMLGRPFAVGKRAAKMWDLDREKLVFEDGTSWWFTDTDTIGADVPICHVGAKEGNEFLKQGKFERPTEVYAISVKELLAERGHLKTKPDVKDHPKIIQEVLDAFIDIQSRTLPEDTPELAERREEWGVHHINLKDRAVPVKLRAIPMSAGEQTIIIELIKDLLTKGYITETSNSEPWTAPVILLRKPGNREGITNQWRIVTDYRGLNEETKPNSYAPPPIREMIDKLRNAKVFGKSDNVGGFYQMTLNPADRKLTTFSVRMGDEGIKSFYFNVACLGLQGTPSSYQSWMEKVVEGIDGVQVYIDDVIYFADTIEELAEVMKKVFARFRAHKVFIHPDKCLFGVTEIDFLGMKVSNNKVSVSDEKVEALKVYPIPDSYAAVRRFVGFAQYLCQFIPKFSEIMSPITETLKGQDAKKSKKKFIWNQACTTAFHHIIRELSTSRGLLIPHEKGQFVLETDASGEGMGYCLYQFVGDQLIPAWYGSKKFNSAERNYNVRDREALAVVFALDKCKAYLLMTPFILFSDHESLMFFKKQPKLKNRDWRWQEAMCRFVFEHRYKKGELMVVPDALSRAYPTRNRTNTGVPWNTVVHGTGAAIKVDPSLSPMPTEVVPDLVSDSSDEEDDTVTMPISVNAVRQLVRVAAARVKVKDEGLVDLIRKVERSFPQAVSVKAEVEEVLPALIDETDDEDEEMVPPLIGESSDEEDCSAMPKLNKLIKRVGELADQIMSPIIPIVKAPVGNISIPVVGGLGSGPVIPEYVDMENGFIRSKEVGRQYCQTTRVASLIVETLPGCEHRGDRVRVPIAVARVFSNVPAIIKKYLLLDPEYRDIYNLLLENNESEWDESIKVKLRHYKVVDKLLYFSPNDSLHDMKIVVPSSPNNELRMLMLYEAHDGAQLHINGDKTYEALSDIYFWPHMSTDTKEYVKTCRECTRKNAGSSRPRGVFRGLTIPETRFEVIQADWITGLPRTEEGYNTILVVMDRLTKYAYFIPARTTDTAEDTAKTLFARVFSIHGCPSVIISDRQTTFCAQFFTELLRIMRVKQRMGTAYYHEFNGALEVLNRTIEVMLRHLVGDEPDQDWTKVLPNVHWAYNTNKHTTLGVSPHFALFGVAPKTALFYASQPEGTDGDSALRVLKRAEAVAFAEAQALSVRRIRYVLLQAQKTMEVHLNRRAKDISFEVGDEVWLWGANLGNSHFKTNVEKFRDRYLGPFTIVSQPSTSTYELKLPREEFPRVSPVFHVSMLWRTKSREDLIKRFCQSEVPRFEDYVDELSEVDGILPNNEVVGARQEECLDRISEVEEIIPEYEPTKELILDKIIKRGSKGRFLVSWIDEPELENSYITWKSHPQYHAEMREFDEQAKYEKRCAKAIQERDLLRQEQQQPPAIRESLRLQEKGLQYYSDLKSQTQ